MKRQYVRDVGQTQGYIVSRDITSATSDDLATGSQDTAEGILSSNEQTAAIQTADSNSWVIIILLVHLTQYNVFVCKTCQYAILADKARSHLKNSNQHRGIFTQNQIQAICSKIKSTPDVMRS